MTDRDDSGATLTPPEAASTQTLRRRIPLQKTFSALHHRNYRLYFTGQLISITGTWMQNVEIGRAHV
jgi:hypothetical protein